MIYYELRYRFFGWLALCAWATTLFMPLQSGEAGYSITTGFNAFLFGWLEHPAWLANLGFFWIVALLIRGTDPPRRLSISLAAITIGLALSAFTWDNAIDELQAAQLFAVRFGYGLYTWVATVCAASLALLARVFQLRMHRKAKD